MTYRLAKKLRIVCLCALFAAPFHSGFTATQDINVGELPLSYSLVIVGTSHNYFEFYLNQVSRAKDKNFSTPFLSVQSKNNYAVFKVPGGQKYCIGRIVDYRGPAQTFDPSKGRTAVPCFVPPKGRAVYVTDVDYNFSEKSSYGKQLFSYKADSITKCNTV